MENQNRNTKKEFKVVLILVFIMLFTMVWMLITVNKFMKSYDLCKDDFKAIEQCGCLPYEGNYAYFVDKDNRSLYISKRNFYLNTINKSNDE